jgi:hypothetical protein
VTVFSHVPQTALYIDGSLVLPRHPSGKGNMEMISVEQQWNDTDSTVTDSAVTEQWNDTDSAVTEQWNDTDSAVTQYVSFAKRPTNAQGSSGFFINTFQIFYPDMFRHMVAILRGS